MTEIGTTAPVLARTATAAPALERPEVVEPRPTVELGRVGTARPRRRPLALRARLALAFASSLVVQVQLVRGDRVLSVDTLTFLESGRSWLAGEGYTRFGTPEVHFPPLVPASLAILERLTGDELLAFHAWIVCWGMAFVAVLVALTRRLSRSDDAAVLAAWFGTLVPGVVVVGFRDGNGSELAAVTLVLGAVLLVASAPWFGSGGRRRSVHLGAAGLLVGLAYLSRPETLVLGVLVAIAVGVAARRSAGSAPWRAALRSLAPFGIAAALFVVPFLAYQHGITGSWSATSKAQDASIDAWRAIASGDREGRDEVVYAIQPDGVTLGPGMTSLTAMAREDPSGWIEIAEINARTIATDYLDVTSTPTGPAWTLVPGFVLVAAAVQLWRARRDRWVPLLAAIAAWPLLTCTFFFVLPRYLLMTNAIAVLLASWAIADLAARLPAPARPWLRIGAVALCLPTFLLAAAPLLPEGRFVPFAFRERTEQIEAGRWVAEHTPADARIMTRSYHVQAYADREVVALPYATYPELLAFARRMGVQYLVADEPTIRHRRPDLYRLLMRSKEAPEGLVLVHQFEIADQRVRIYRLDPAPPPSDQAPIPLGYVSD